MAQAMPGRFNLIAISDLFAEKLNPLGPEGPLPLCKGEKVITQCSYSFWLFGEIFKPAHEPTKFTSSLHP